MIVFFNPLALPGEGVSAFTYLYLNAGAFYNATKGS